jgi:hypothetical protein
MQKWTVCQTCNGTGKTLGTKLFNTAPSKEVVCEDCCGTGEVRGSVVLTEEEVKYLASMFMNCGILNYTPEVPEEQLQSDLDLYEKLTSKHNDIKAVYDLLKSANS